MLSASLVGLFLWLVTNLYVVDASTYQVYHSDKIEFEGDDAGTEHELLSWPLEDFPKPAPIDPHFTPTGHSRGYTATWVVGKDKVLYLKKVDGQLEASRGSVYNGGRDIMEKYFPGQQGLVPATWFTGELRIPEGEPVWSSDSGYGHPVDELYEKKVIMTVEKGKIIAEKEIKLTEEEKRAKRAEMTEEENSNQPVREGLFERAKRAFSDYLEL